jgi:hypothetical protein
VSVTHVLDLGPKVGRATLRIEETAERVIVEETLPFDIPKAPDDQLRAAGKWRSAIFGLLNLGRRRLLFIVNSPSERVVIEWPSSSLGASDGIALRPKKDGGV